MALQKMDEPHKIIHATAKEVLQRAERGDLDGAMKLLAERRNHELAELSRLFEEGRRILREHQRELAVVLTGATNILPSALTWWKRWSAFPRRALNHCPPRWAGQSEKLQWRIGKRARTSQTILLLNEDFLFSHQRG